MPAFTMPRFMARRRTALVASVSAGLLVAGILSVGSAQAAPSTKYYTATVTPSPVAASSTAQQFSLTLTNCGAKAGPCPRASQQTLGSANIQVDPAFGTVQAASAPGWNVSVDNDLIELRSSGIDLNPGSALTITVTAVAATPGTYTWTAEAKQSNDFSGTGNDFTLSSPQPTVTVLPGIPDHLVFETQPSTVQVSTPMATGPRVQVVDAHDNPVGIIGISILLAPATDVDSGDPGLGGCTTASTDDNGLATFGSATSGSACLTASNIGIDNIYGGYELQATATWNGVSLKTEPDSMPFDVVQVLTTCDPNDTCKGSASGTHTTVDVTGGSAASTDQLEIAVGIDALQACLPFTPPNGLQVTRVFLDNRDKTIKLTFDKYLVNQVPNNGTPLFTICFAAPGTSSSSDPWAGWMTASGSGPTFIPDANNPDTGNWVGILPDCTASNLLPQNPCVQSRSKHAANEIVTVLVPYQSGRADPKLW